MADLIHFTLPSINENTDEKTMKQIKNYLFQLTEQMKFYLNNIDTDNFTDSYNLHLSKMADSQTANAQALSVTKQILKKYQNNFNNSIAEAVAKIAGNKGGYIVTLDTNEDGFPDDLRILSDTSDYATSQKYWQFNREGLAYIENTGSSLKSSLALSADGYIIADRVKGNLGEFVTLNACTLNACTGSFSGQITAGSGRIANWEILRDTLMSRIDGDEEGSCWEVKIKNDMDDQGKPTKKAFYVNYFTGGYNSDTLPKWEEDKYKEEKFYIRRNGEMMCKSGSIGAFKIGADYNHYYRGGLYSDYVGDVQAYRTFIQPAYFDADKGNAGNTWVFSTQYSDVADGKAKGYVGKWYVTAKGDMHTYGTSHFYNDVIIHKYVYDSYGYEVINTNSNNALVIGYGQYEHSNPTYLEGGTLYLRHKGSTGSLQIQENTSTIFTFENSGWTFEGIDSHSVNRNTIESSGGFVISANKGNNWMYLVADTTCIRGDANISGYLTINWTANSGLAPLYVNASGVVVCSTSSERYKKNITDNLEDWLNPERLYDLPVVQYNYKDEFRKNELVAGTQIGITAEDVEKYYPNALIRNAEGQAESWQDRIMIPAMLKLIQAQKREIDTLKNSLQNKKRGG